MKKYVIVFALCAFFVMLSSVTALSLPTLESVQYVAPIPRWDGEFIGAYGRVITTEEGRDFEAHGYIVGVYKGARRGRFYGNVYNLEEEQIGTIGAYFGKYILVGHVENLEGRKAPIVGFLLRNETMFFGRIMSLFGPAPHIIGYHWTV